MNVTNGISNTAKALTRLGEIAFGFVNSQAPLSACELGVFDPFADGPTTADAVASRVKIHPTAVDDAPLSRAGRGGNEPNAKERTEAEYQSLVDAASFDLTGVLRLDAPRDLVIARTR